eukprot:SM000080S22910  [mRNA]  locus=s80:67313:69092:+ [translate_table: standard]
MLRTLETARRRAAHLASANLSLEPGRSITPSSYRTKVAVILNTSVDHLGTAGQVVHVEPGYARNKLIPQKLAHPAIEKYLKFRKHQQEKVVEIENTATLAVVEETSSAEAAAQTLDKGRLVFRRDVGDASTLRQPVRLPDIVNEARRQLNVQLQESNLIMAGHLTTLGDFELPLIFPPELTLPGGKAQIHLKVRVRRK